MRVVRHESHQESAQKLAGPFDHLTSVQKLEGHQEPEVPNVSTNELQLKRDRNETRELMELIMGLNKSVKSLSSRFDTFSTKIEGKVNKLQSEFVLMKNKVEFIERNLGNVNQASRSSAEYTINTHPSS